MSNTYIQVSTFIPVALYKINKSISNFIWLQASSKVDLPEQNTKQDGYSKQRQSIAYLPVGNLWPCKGSSVYSQFVPTTKDIGRLLLKSKQSGLTPWKADAQVTFFRGCTSVFFSWVKYIPKLCHQLINFTEA